MDNENNNVPENTTEVESAIEEVQDKITPQQAKRLDFAARFKPCKLVMFYAHGHRVNDYKVTDREAEVLGDGTEVSRWKTEKTVQDPGNATKATTLRSKFIREVVKLGAQYGKEKLVFVDFERADDLDGFRAEWRKIVQEFNAQSPVVKVDLGVLPPLDLTGSNEYLLGNLLDEMKDTMAEMKAALENADYASVSNVVKRLKGFVTLVPDKQATAIVSAIADAKKQARSMKAMLEKKGVEIAKVQEMVNTSTVDLAVAACFFDDDIVIEGPSASDLMEAQAQEYSAAIGQGYEDDDEEAQAEDEPEVQATALVVDPEGDQQDDEDQQDNALAAQPDAQDRYWL
jgi:hypothetical protein